MILAIATNKQKMNLRWLKVLLICDIDYSTENTEFAKNCFARKLSASEVQLRSEVQSHWQNF